MRRPEPIGLESTEDGPSGPATTIGAAGGDPLGGMAWPPGIASPAGSDSVEDDCPVDGMAEGADRSPKRRCRQQQCHQGHDEAPRPTVHLSTPLRDWQNAGPSLGPAGRIVWTGIAVYSFPATVLRAAVCAANSCHACYLPWASRCGECRLCRSTKVCRICRLRPPRVDFTACLNDNFELGDRLHRRCRGRPDQPVSRRKECMTTTRAAAAPARAAAVALLAAFLAIRFTPELSSAANPRHLASHGDGLHGYIGYEATRPSACAEFVPPHGLYSAVWPLD